MSSPSKKYFISRELSSSTQSLSSSPGMTKRMFDDIMEDDKMQNENDVSSVVHPQISSPRSSGYWSEIESNSDHETEKISAASKRGSDSFSRSDKSMRKLAIIDGVLSGNSSAWENTKALFRQSSPDVLRNTLDISLKDRFKSENRGISLKNRFKSENRDIVQERRHSAPEWHFKKFLENHKNQVSTRIVKVTDL